VLPIDPELLAGFLAEVRGYLPRIASALAVAREPAAFAEPYRLMHSIKGASSMIGLAGLAHVASYAEQALDELQLGERGLDAPLAALLGTLLDRIDAGLEDIASGEDDGHAMLAATVADFRRFRGLAEEGDAAELAAPEKREIAGFPSPSLPDDGPGPFSSFEDFDSPGRPTVGADLLETFLEEAEDHLRAIATSLRTFRLDAGDRPALLTVRRSVHTLKGAASLVGFGDLARIAHRMEDLLDLLADGEELPSAADLALLLRTTDALEDLAAGGLPPELAELAARYDERLPETSPHLAPFPASSPVDPGSQRLARFLDGGSDSESAAEEAGGGAAGPAGPTLRVPLERLDDVVRLASELVVHRSIFERHVADLQRRVEEMSASQERLRRLAGRLEADYEVRALAGSAVGAMSEGRGFGAAPPGFDALEFDRYTEFHLLSRELAETASDLSTVGVEVASSLVDFDGDLTRLSRLSSDVQNRLMRLRMVPFAQLASRLHRAVRVTAAQEGKPVDLEIEGEAVELDKTVLEELADPLLHLLRNAVSHGIEPAALRRAAGKPPRGRIRVQAVNEGTEVTVRVSDDGAGMDPQGLIAAALAAGRLSETEAASLSDDQAIELAFLPGLSTAALLSEVSGRGVGLDVVRAGARRAKGTVSVRSASGHGATFDIRLPMSLAVARVLMVRAHGESFAMPLSAVAQILRVERSAIEKQGSGLVLTLDGRVYPFLHLGRRLGLAAPADESSPQVPVLLLALGDRRAALGVDQVGHAREVVVKPLGPLLGKVPGISGATLTGDGEVVLIVSPGELVADEARGMGSALVSWAAATEADSEGAGEKAARALEILVVDDSLSVRRVLGNLLSGAGWKPVPARDGLEALELLQQADRMPDAILLDIEMPRMDGYELTATLRGMAEFAAVPIVILTSRAGEKHRQRAFELGASEYLVKPYEDAALLAMIRRLVREALPT